MPFVVTALVLLCALCVFLLLLNLAVLRRLREHEERFEQLAQGVGSMAPYDASTLVGRTVPELAAHAPEDGALIGFFSVGCDACHEQAPRFAAPEGEADGTAFVVGTPADELLTLLSGVPHLVSGERSDQMADAAGIQAFPTFLRVAADGTVLAAATDLAELPDTAVAAVR
ncbi:hypothetical protein P8605_40610 [Streptomyces sp. T-3]|nr:hypothetical protein [Streptomyces sp. T-3]